MAKEKSRHVTMVIYDQTKILVHLVVTDNQEKNVSRR